MKNIKVFAFAAALIFAFNLLFLFLQYKTFTEYPYTKLTAKLISQKVKVSQNGNRYTSLVFKGENITFKTISSDIFKEKEDGYFELTLKTSNVGFLDFIKGPKLKATEIRELNKKDTLKQAVKEFITSQHADERIKELYLNLFLNSEVSSEVDDFIQSYGLGAFFALSGLNVALLTGFMFLLFSPLFAYFQDRYFPYANRTVWIVSASLLFLLFYAYLTDFTPSFIRAVVSAFALFYLSLRGENLLGGKTLIAAVIVCVSIFPTFLFSVGFWLSVYGVLMIYIFTKNTEFKNDTTSYFALSIWLFFAMQPILHYLFGIFTGAHLLNPIFGGIFDVFYPLSFVLHLFNIGWLFDDMLISFIKSAGELARYEFKTPTWFFAIYLFFALFAVFKKEWFLMFNITITVYGISAGIYLLSGI